MVQVTDGILHAHVSPTIIQQDPGLGLDTSRSSLEVVAMPSLFAGGRAALKCEANVYRLYSASANTEVLEDTPHLAPVMGPTAPQHSHEDDETGKLLRR